MIPTVKSYFSGAGLMDLGLQNAGLDIKQSLEIDIHACNTLRKNFNHEILEEDIANRTVLSQEKTDIMVGTYPCTKYSAIADISGTRDGDDLFLHMFRHIALEKPEMYVIENVVGMKQFPIVMEAMSKLPDYYVHMECPLNANLWLPQNRARLILIGTRRPFNFRPPVVEKKVTLKEIVDPCPEYNITYGVMNRINGKHRDNPIVSDPDKGDNAPCCVAHFHKDKSTRLVVDKSHKNGVRPYTMREYARLMGVPDSFEFAGTKNQAIKQIGNGVAVPMAEWIGREAMRYFNR